MDTQPESIVFVAIMHNTWHLTHDIEYCVCYTWKLYLSHSLLYSYYYSGLRMKQTRYQLFVIYSVEPLHSKYTH